MKKDQIGFIISERYMKDPYPWNLIEFCKKKGHDVEVIIPEHIQNSVDDFVAKSSLYIHRNHNQKGLQILSKVEKTVKVFNSSTAVYNCQNKLIVQDILNNSDLPAPEEISCEQLIRSNSKDVFPVICKPIHGNNGEGIIIYRSREEWLKRKINLSNYIIQKYIENDGYDIKLYCIDKEVFAVKKQSPIHKDKNIKAELIECTEEMKEVAMKCSKLFDLNIFGVDTIRDSNGNLYVIEVNECSSFVKLPDLPDRLYSYISKVLSG